MTTAIFTLLDMLVIIYHLSEVEMNINSTLFAVNNKKFDTRILTQCPVLNKLTVHKLKKRLCQD